MKSLEEEEEVEGRKEGMVEAAGVYVKTLEGYEKGLEGVGEEVEEALAALRDIEGR